MIAVSKTTSITDALKLALWLAKNTVRLHEMSYEIGMAASLGEDLALPQIIHCRNITEAADRLIEMIGYLE